MIVDSLRPQISAPFKAELKKSKFFLVQGVKGATDIWQPVDAGLGLHYQRRLGFFSTTSGWNLTMLNSSSSGVLSLRPFAEFLTKWTLLFLCMQLLV